MAVRSALLSYQIGDIKSDDEIVDKIQDTLKTLCPEMKKISVTDVNDGKIVLFGSKLALLNGSMRIYKSKKLVTLNLDECIENDKNVALTNHKVESIRKKLSAVLNEKIEKIPVIKRASAVPNYYVSSDDRILEYDFEEMVFEGHSQYQHVKILKSPSLGNCLILDDLQNLAEVDLSYTRGLMKYGEISYKDKEILILGGGDGGLLHELLKENPKFVTLVDIDKMVIDSCSKHLRGACGNSLDNLKGINYEVIVGDCIAYMEQYITANASFDFVFNDLTDIPICPGDSKAGDYLKSNDDEMWNFLKKILTLSFQLVRPNGRYLNHVIIKFNI